MRLGENFVHVNPIGNDELTNSSAEIVRWVSENARPFSIVSDRGFKSLMKTGRPEYYLPSPSTVARDVRHVFARSRQRISAFLRVRQPLCLSKD